MTLLTLSPVAWQQFSDTNGTPVPGGLLYTYAAGGTTPLAIYTDSAGAVAHPNPAVLDSGGYLTFYLLPASYKFILKTAAGVTLKTQDNIGASPTLAANVDISGPAGENLTSTNSVYLCTGAGGDPGTVGSWYKADADSGYSSSIAAAVGFATSTVATGATVSVRIAGRLEGFSALTAGAMHYVSATAGAITATPPTFRRPVGYADTTTSLVINTGRQESAECWIDTTIQTVGNVGAGEDTLISTTLPGGTLARDGEHLIMLAWGTVGAANEAKVIKWYFGSTAITAYSATVASTGTWQSCLVVIRTGAATQLLLLSGSGSGGSVAMVTNTGTATETLSGDIITKLTGEATTTNSIVQSGLIRKLVG